MLGLTGSRSTVPFLITRWGKVESERSAPAQVGFPHEPGPELSHRPRGGLAAVVSACRRVPLKLAAPGSPSPGMPSPLFLDKAASGYVAPALQAELGQCSGGYQKPTYSFQTCHEPPSHLRGYLQV